MAKNKSINPAVLIVSALILLFGIALFASPAHSQSNNQSVTYGYGGVQLSVDGVVLSSPTVDYWQPQSQYGTWVPPNTISILPQQQIGIVQPRYGTWSPSVQTNWQPERSRYTTRQPWVSEIRRQDFTIDRGYIGEQSSNVSITLFGVPLSVRIDKWSGTSVCLGSSWGCF